MKTKFNEVVKTTPITIPKTVRNDTKTILTSGYAGKVLPLACVPLVREDAVSRGTMSFNFEMMETAEMLMNGINVTVYAHFVPFLAFERFGGSMTILNNSYSGLPDKKDGTEYTSFIETMAFDRDAPFWRTLGMHRKGTGLVNTAYVEAYNAVINMRRAARSNKLTLRDKLDTSLAAAFWKHTSMAHIVPDFDSAKIDGEVPLNVVASKMPVKGIGVGASDVPSWGPITPRGQEDTFPRYYDGNSSQGDTWFFQAGPQSGDLSLDIYAEMQQNGITVSLSNIEMAKQTAAFARMRAEYKGVSDDHLIDLLMQGIRIPEEQMAEPILLGRQSTLFGYQRRFATDGDNLAKSVTGGETRIDMTVRTPPMNTGGVIIFTAEIVPEQLFERQKDHFLHMQGPDEFPNPMADFLDPQKVEIVPNDYVDVDHNDASGTFGYAPLNHKWKRNIPNIGGKYYRPEVDAAFDEDRQKIWANETPNPELTEDFWLATNIHHKVFATDQQDPFEIIATGDFQIVGHTQFGKGLQEATDDFEHILQQVDQERINQKPVDWSNEAGP